MTPQALRQLSALIEARKARDLARLDGLLSEDRRLEAEVTELAGTIARDLAENPAMPPSQQALRQAWVDQRIRLAHRRRADLAAGIRAARAEAIQSFGKHQALEELVERAERSEAQVRLARAEREAAPPAERPNRE